VVVEWRPLKPAERASPSGTVVSTRALPKKEIAPARELVSEKLRSQEFAAAIYAEKCLLFFYQA
jgi:hypothetical protein